MCKRKIAKKISAIFFISLVAISVSGCVADVQEGVYAGGPVGYNVGYGGVVDRTYNNEVIDNNVYNRDVNDNTYNRNVDNNNGKSSGGGGKSSGKSSGGNIGGHGGVEHK